MTSSTEQQDPNVLPKTRNVAIGRLMSGAGGLCLLLFAGSFVSMIAALFFVDEDTAGVMIGAWVVFGLTVLAIGIAFLSRGERLAAPLVSEERERDVDSPLCSSGHLR